MPLLHATSERLAMTAFAGAYCPTSLSRPLSEVTTHHLYYDRVVVRLSTAEPDLDLDELAPHCGKPPKTFFSELRYSPQFKSGLDLFQPTALALRKLQKQVQGRYTYSFVRVEVALDLATTTKGAACKVWDALVQHISLSRLRSPVHIEENVTAYWGSRKGKSVAAYYDKPSKVTGGHCAHIELRATDSRTIAALGAQTLEELADLRLKSVLKKHLRLIALVSKQDLGRWCDGHELSPTRQALRNRAAKFLNGSDNLVWKGRPIAHNLRLECKDEGMPVKQLFREIDNSVLFLN
jgi:hypothetical protein